MSTIPPDFHPGVKLSGDECRLYSNAVADVLCWFAGFRAAHHGNGDGPELPPNIEELRSLNLKLKTGWRE